MPKAAALTLALALALLIPAAPIEARSLKDTILHRSPAHASDAPLVHTSDIVALAFSPDGRLCATGSAAPECGILIWDLASGAAVARFGGDKSSITALVFSPDGETLASTAALYSGSCQVRLWDVASGAGRRTIPNGANEVRALAYSPDGAILAGCDDGRVIHLWRAATGEVTRTFELPRGYPTGLAFSPDGARLACTSGNRLFVFDLASGQAVASYEQGATTTSVAWSRDGAWLASAGGETVKLWDPIGGVLRATYTLESVPRSVAFSPQGGLLACSDTVNRIRIFDLATGRARDDFVVPGWQSGLPVCAFTPDSARVGAACERAPRLFVLAP